MINLLRIKYFQMVPILIFIYFTLTKCQFEKFELSSKCKYSLDRFCPSISNNNNPRDIFGSNCYLFNEFKNPYFQMNCTVDFEKYVNNYHFNKNYLCQNVTNMCEGCFTEVHCAYCYAYIYGDCWNAKINVCPNLPPHDYFYCCEMTMKCVNSVITYFYNSSQNIVI